MSTAPELNTPASSTMTADRGPADHSAADPSPADRALWSRRSGQPVALRIALLAFAWVSVLAIAALTHHDIHQSLMWLSVTIIPIDLICIWFVLRRARQEGGIRTVIDFKPVDIAWGLLAAVILFVAFYVSTLVGFLLAYGGHFPTDDGGSFHVPLWVGLLCGIVMPITIAFAEELVYRGYAQRRMTWASNRWAAWVSVAVLFALQHVFLTDVDLRAQIARFIAMVLCGLVFGALSWWWKRISPLVIGHWALDFVGLGLPLLMAGLS